MRSRRATALASSLVCAIVASGSTSCRTVYVKVPIPPPPLASEEVRLELHALEGTETCEATRDFLLDEVGPYFAGLRAIRR
jgi:hypothetical protein